MSNPTAEEITEIARSGNTGEVKSLTDLKLEKLERRLTELEKVNAELRAANAELYSFAAQVTQPAPAAEPQPPTAPVQPVAAVKVAAPQPDAEAQRARDEANLNSVLVEMGYLKSNEIKDGM